MKRAKTKKRIEAKEDAQREEILDERHSLQELFPASYAPQIGVFSSGKVEVMLTLTYSQAEKLAGLLKKNKL